MMQPPRCHRFRASYWALVMAGLLGGVGLAGEPGWSELALGTVSGRVAAIDSEIAGLEAELAKLPGVPIDDQGGTGGFATLHPQATPPAGVRYAMELRWQAEAQVEMVALVPARRYDANGLDAQYGLPDEFTVELIDSAGAVVAKVADERAARSHPVRKGHPFVYQVSPPVVAVGLRISAGLLQRDAESDGNYVHAWAEAFVFEGDADVAMGAEVRSLSGSVPAAPWHWHPRFLVDGQTPLGLPEVPAGEHRNIGWISEGRPKATDSASLTVDLGKEMEVDAIRLVPAKRPTSDLPSGFGFPRKLAISVGGAAAAVREWPVVATRDLLNPGNNPVVVGFPAATGRLVRIEATELWKAFDSYPAFFALSEVEVLSQHQNVALGKVVRSSDGMLNLIAPGGRFWNSASLSDGFGPDGRLVPTRDWLNQLDRRLQLETQRYGLRREASQLVNGWRRTKLTVLTVLGVVGACLIIVLPIRYRIHVRRDLMHVRERIAGDLHDEVGSNLGSIQMFVDLAQGRSGPSDDLKRIQRIAAETVSAVRDIVWLLRPEGEHRIGTVEHLRETSSIMLESLDWHFTANEAAWQVELGEEATRHLFLFFREALHNIMRHAKAAKVEVRVAAIDGQFKIELVDDGVGIAPERLERPATLRALRQRAEALGAELRVDSQPGQGTRIELAVPLTGKRRRSAGRR